MRKSGKTDRKATGKNDFVRPGPETYEAEIIVFQPLPGQGEAKIAKITRL